MYDTDAIQLPEIQVSNVPDQPAVDIGSGVPDPQPMQIDVDPNSQAGQPLPPDLATWRTNMAHFGLSSMNKNYDEIYSHVVSGQEDLYRQKVATEIDAQKNQTATQALFNMSLDPNIKPEALQTAVLATQQPPTDPKSVFEEAFAHAFVGQIDQTASDGGGDTNLPKVDEVVPGYMDSIKPLAVEAVTKRLYALTAAQDIQKDIKSQSWAGWGLDTFLNGFQSYKEYNLRGNTSEVGFFHGGFLGNNLDAQRQALTQLPLDQYKEKFDRAIEHLKGHNPQLAMEYALSVAGETTSDQVIQNMFTPLVMFDVGVVKAISHIGMAAIFGRRVARSAPRMTADEVEAAAAGNAKDVTKDVVIDGKTPEEAKGFANKTVGDMVKAARVEPTDKAVAASGAGDIQTAAIETASRNVAEDLKGNFDEPQRAVDQLMAGFRYDKQQLVAQPGESYGPITAKLEQAAAKDDKLLTLIQDAIKADRIPGVLDIQPVMAQIAEEARNRHPGLADTIINVNVHPNPLTNTFTVETVMGQHGGLFFDDYESAFGAAALRSIGDFKIHELKQTTGIPQIGQRYYISSSFPLQLTQDLIRDNIVRTALQKDPEGLIRVATGWLTTPDNHLATYHQQNRKAAEYGANRLISWADASFRAIRNIKRGAISTDPITGEIVENTFGSGKEQYKDFGRLLRYLQQDIDPKTNLPGRFFERPGDIYEWYDTFIKRRPVDAEVQGYYEFKRVVEGDRVIRNLIYTRNMWNLGVEQHTFSAFNPKTNKTDYSPALKGVRLNHYPGGDGSIVMIGDKVGEELVYMNGRVPPKALKRMQEAVKDGSGQIIELYNSHERPLSGWGLLNYENRPRWVFVKALHPEPVRYDNIPRRGGGHWVDDPAYSVKQANMQIERVGKSIVAHYEGDNHLHGVDFRPMGEDLAKHMTNITRLMSKRATGQVKKYLKDNKLPYPAKDVISWYSPTKDPDGVMRAPRLSAQINPFTKDVEPFVVTTGHDLIVNMSKDLEKRWSMTHPNGDVTTIFKDSTREGALEKQYQVPFSQERDLHNAYTMEDWGNAGNPVYQYVPTRFVDPIEVMAKSFNRIAHSYFLDDYKNYAIETWIQRAAPHLTASPAELKNAPMHFFFHPVYKPNTPLIVKSQLMSSNWSIRSFLGVSNPVARVVKEATQIALDKTYGRFGPKAANLVPEFMIEQIQDPTKFFRQMTTHLKLGLYAVGQIATQAQTYTLIGAYSPRSVMSGTHAAFMDTWARRNFGMLDHIDTKAAAFGVPGTNRFKPGQFKEAFEGLNNSGFRIVNNEQEFLKDARSTSFIKTKAGDLLDSGLIFFKSIERGVRMGAWYSSYLEFRAANPNGRLTNEDWLVIENRADDLYQNMSRASSSNMHSGPFAMTSQFLSYQLRVQEQFWGPRADNVDRARVIAIIAAAYGITSATNVTGIPMGDYIRKWAIANDYIVGDHWLSTCLMEGIPSCMIGMATGRYWNIGDRWGFGGFSPIRDLLRGDVTWWKIIGGASASVMGSIADKINPFYQFMLNSFRGEESWVEPTWSDLANILSEAAAFSQGRKFLAVMNTGTLISSKGIPLETEVTKSEGLIGLLTGLQPQEITDMTLQKVTLKDREENEKFGADKFVEYFVKASQIAIDDPEGAKPYFRNAFAYMSVFDVRQDRYPAIQARAERSLSDSAVHQVDWEYYISRAPESKKDKLREIFERKP